MNWKMIPAPPITSLHVDPDWKASFHEEWEKRFRKVARDLGLKRGQYTVRSNKAGPAILGEVTLHSDSLYVQVGGSIQGQERKLMYRSCTSQSDYTGGTNHYMTTDTFESDYDTALNTFKKVAA